MAEYLAIKNWKKFQSGRKGWEWIKDYVDQDDEPEIASLSMFERGVLQELRRLRGRTGKNILNEVTFIALAIHAKPTDRPHLRHAVATLIARQLLVLTDQPHDSLDEKREEEKREEKQEQKEAQPKPDMQRPQPPPDSDSKIEEIAKAHPKHRKPRETEREIVMQLDRLGDQMGIASAMKYLLERTLTYAKAYELWPKERQRFSPESPRWFGSACFDEDPASWEPEGSDESEPPSSPAPAAQQVWNYPRSGEEQAVALWNDMKRSLAAAIPKHSFDTWIKPTIGGGIKGDTLYVRIPVEEFMHVEDKFGDLITERLPETIATVKFIAPISQAAGNAPG